MTLVGRPNPINSGMVRKQVEPNVSKGNGGSALRSILRHQVIIRSVSGLRDSKGAFWTIFLRTGIKHTGIR